MRTYRFIDRKDKQLLLSETAAKGEFRPRTHTAPPKRVFVFFLLVQLLILGLVLQLGITLAMLPPATPTPVAEILVVLMIIGILGAGLAGYAFHLLQELTAIISFTEFQNLLLSRAAAAGASFCMLVNDRFASVMFDDGFSRFVLGRRIISPAEGFECLIDKATMSRVAEKELRNAVSECRSAEVILSVGQNKKQRKFRLEVLPLTTPSGYSWLRAFPLDSV